MSCYVLNYRLKKCFQYVNEELRDDSNLKNPGKINKSNRSSPISLAIIVLLSYC